MPRTRLPAAFRPTAALVLVLAAGLANANDVLLWTGASASIGLTDSSSVVISEWLRFDDRVTRFYGHHSDIGVLSNPARWFAFSLNYRHLYERSRQAWCEESRPYGTATFRYALGPLSFSDHTRAERRMRPGRNTHWRYRTRVTTTLPRRLAGRPIEPCAAVELFHESDRPGLATGRLYVGQHLGIGRGTKLETYYFWQFQRQQGEMTGSHVFGTILKFDR